MRATLWLVPVALLTACEDQPAGPPQSVQGSVSVTVRLHGNGVDTSGFSVEIGGQTARIPVGTTQVDSVPAGSYTVSLGDVATHCFSGPSMTVDVKARDTVATALDVTCIGDIAFEEWVDTAPTISYLRPDGRVVRVTTAAGRDGYADWSPDGTRLVFVHATNVSSGVSDIFTVRIDGSELHPLTTDGAGNSAPHWSPDGQTIIYTKQSWPSSTVHIMNADGTGDHVFIDNLGEDFDATWAAHGDTVVFSTNRFGTRWDLAVASKTGTGLRKLAPGNAQHASASPDGAQIAYQTYDSLQAIWVQPLNNAGATPVNLTPSLTSYGFAWSPDGTRLAVSTCQVCTNGDYRDQMVNRDGTGLVPLSNVGDNAGHATFSPDGAWILFDSFKGGRGQQLWVLKADGSESHRITDAPTAKNNASFNPVTVLH